METSQQSLLYLSVNTSRFREVPMILKSDWNKLQSYMTILPWHKILWWQMLANCLPVRDILGICFPIFDINCPICHSNIENILHLFVYCDLAKKLWLASPWNLRLDSLELASPMHFLRFLWTMEA